MGFGFHRDSEHGVALLFDERGEAYIFATDCKNNVVGKVKTGEVTIVRLAQTDGELVIHAAGGKAVRPETWEEAGWAPPAPQLPSLEVIFECDSDRFLRDVMGQHYIVTYGDNLELIGDFAAITGIRLIVCR